MILELSFQGIMMTTKAIHSNKNGFPVLLDFFGELTKVDYFEKVFAFLDLLIMNMFVNATSGERALSGDFFIGLNGLGIVGLEGFFL